MKPVLYRVVDKNGDEIVTFHPTSKMMIYALRKARSPGAPETELCASCGIEPSSPRKWKEKYGSYFSEWLEEFMELESGQDHELLEAVGMAQALQGGNFQYWREMARMKGVLKDEIKPSHITINTDFSQILIASGGNLEAARERLLASARGLEFKEGVRVVDALELREPASAGDGAIEVQDESMALAHALGGDRGRSE